MIKLPEPAYPAGSKGMLGENCYTESQLKQAVRDAYEDAANVCEVQEYEYWRSSVDQDFTPIDCANAIRALIKEIPE